MAQQDNINRHSKSSQLGQRLDQAVAELFTDFSALVLKSGFLTAKSKWMAKLILKPRTIVLAVKRSSYVGELMVEERWEAQDIPLDIVYEDDDLLLLNKPRDLVVHPGAGTPDGTIL